MKWYITEVYFVGSSDGPSAFLGTISNIVSNVETFDPGVVK